MEKSSSKSSFFSFASPLKSNLKASSAKARSLCWQKSVKEDNANWTTVDKQETAVEELRRGRLTKRRCSAPCAVALDVRSRKPSLKSIQMMKLGSSEVPSPSNSICSEENELTEDQRRELRKAFIMFEKGGKNKMAARDLGALLRCLGWNPSERELEEAKHELVVSYYIDLWFSHLYMFNLIKYLNETESRLLLTEDGSLVLVLSRNDEENEKTESKDGKKCTRGSVTFSEIERFMARRGGIFYGCKDKEDIQEAFQVLDGDGDGKISVGDFRYFMTTLGEKMSDEEVEEMLTSVYKRKHNNFDSIEYNDLIEGFDEASLGT